MEKLISFILCCLLMICGIVGVITQVTTLMRIDQNWDIALSGNIILLVIYAGMAIGSIVRIYQLWNEKY